MPATKCNLRALIPTNYCQIFLQKLSLQFPLFFDDFYGLCKHRLSSTTNKLKTLVKPPWPASPTTTFTNVKSPLFEKEEKIGNPLFHQNPRKAEKEEKEEKSKEKKKKRGEREFLSSLFPCSLYTFLSLKVSLHKVPLSTMPIASLLFLSWDR